MESLRTMEGNFAILSLLWMIDGGDGGGYFPACEDLWEKVGPFIPRLGFKKKKKN